jgi:hypothetical protein
MADAPVIQRIIIEFDGEMVRSSFKIKDSMTGIGMLSFCKMELEDRIRGGPVGNTEDGNSKIISLAGKTLPKVR